MILGRWCGLTTAINNEDLFPDEENNVECDFDEIECANNMLPEPKKAETGVKTMVSAKETTALVEK